MEFRVGSVAAPVHTCRPPEVVEVGAGRVAVVAGGPPVVDRDEPLSCAPRRIGDLVAATCYAGEHTEDAWPALVSADHDWCSNLGSMRPVTRVTCDAPSSPVA